MKKENTIKFIVRSHEYYSGDLYLEVNQSSREVFLVWEPYEGGEIRIELEIGYSDYRNELKKLSNSLLEADKHINKLLGGV